MGEEQLVLVLTVTQVSVPSMVITYQEESKIFQKGADYSDVKLFNHLPLKIRSISNEIKLFKTTLKMFLSLHSFYSVEEYLEYSFN